MLRRLLEANASTLAPPPSPSSFPPLPVVPEPAIFDPSYAALLEGVLSDKGFPPGTPAQKIYYTRLKVIEAITASRKESAESVSVNLLVAWGSMVLLCVYLLVRIRRNRLRALLGDVDAAHKIVLPAFEPLLWLLGGLNLFLIVGFGALLLADDIGAYYNRTSIELAIAIKLMNGLLVVTYMLQPSLSRRALWVATAQTLVLSGYTVPVVAVLNAVATRENQRWCYWTLMVARFLLAIYLLGLIARPPARASVLSFRLLCLYVVGMVLQLYWMAESYHRGATEAATVVGWIIAGYSALLPLSVWHVLRADTEHWRGIGKRAVELQDTFRRKNGKIDERVSSQGLHVLIEMHRKFIIDFARLQVREPIGTASGSSTDRAKTTVYAGFLHTKKVPVAIKVYMPTDFTEATVAEFSHEAALCGALSHPNILTFHGLCVCPPNICLVTELCEASLHDLLEAQADRRRHGRAVSLRRQQTQLLLNIGFMLDAARALAYLHSFSPPFVHRDIKPSNFLVDDEGTVKLTDFGASRTLSVRSTSGHQHQPDLGTVHQTSAVAGQTVLEMPGVVSRLAKQTAQYMAPEVIRSYHAGGSFFGEASDVFSLAMTMWDILHPGQDKYPIALVPGPADPQIFELVCAGHRPLVDPLAHAGLRELLETAWHADARMRPTAQTLVASLEAIQTEVGASFAAEFQDELSTRCRSVMTPRMPSSSAGHTEQLSFAGSQAVETLRSCDYVGAEREAIRLGNLLMDCGFLHHTKHARCFEYSATQYAFDADQIAASQPLTMLESDHETGVRGATQSEDLGYELMPHDGTKHQANAHRFVGAADVLGGRARAGSHSSHALMEDRCACRKLGQRIETERTTHSRFRLKFKLFADDNSLTANLLADDQPVVGMGHFAALHEPSGRRKGRKGTATSEVV